MSEAWSLLDAAYTAARWGWYLAIFLVLGASTYAPFLFAARTGFRVSHPDLAAGISRRAARIGCLAAGLALGFALLRLYCQSRSLLDPEEPLTRDFLGAVLNTGWGTGWLRQAAMGVLALLGFAGATRGSGLAWMVAAAAGGGLGLVAGMTGHAATPRGGSLGLFLTAAHVWAGGFWLGGLAVMLGAALPACRTAPPEEQPGLVRMLVADFSRRALICAPLVVGVGVWLAIRYLGWSWPLTMFESKYGIALAIKLAALAGVAALGAWNWRVVQPRLADASGESRLRRSGLVELILGALLLAATAALVALPLPGDEM